MSHNNSEDKKPKKLNVAFLHPDLGIGGAERLIVDAAMALKSVGNSVTIYTSHCDRTHCFEEIKNGQLDVQVYGDFLPTHFAGKFYIVFAFLRQLYLSLKLILSFQIFKYDIIILDQLSYCIPLLHLFSGNSKIMFYCHFPDQLLAPHTSLIRSIYRKLFDTIEELSTSYSDHIVVNSQFTRSVVRKTFKSLKNEPLDVIYPCVSTDEKTFTPSSGALQLFDKLLQNKSYFLSINRFERKKNIQLAIDAYANYISTAKDKDQIIVIAGGYDNRVLENVEYLNELKHLCDELNLNYEVLSPSVPNLDLSNYKVPKVLFLTSISTDLKNTLISNCDILLYTPSNEHFGIVPLEAMRAGKLVLADKSGGPLETIVDYFDDETNYTGFTVESTVKKWTDVLLWVKNLTKNDLDEVSLRTKNRVNEKFSFNALRDQLVSVTNRMVSKKSFHSLIIHIFAPIIAVLIATYLYKYII